MSIVSKLSDSKNALDALLSYANDATGQADADIGEAIRTLVDGFGKGGGGSNPKVFVKDFTPTGGGDYARTYPIQHNLGTTDVTVLAWLMDTNGVKASSSSSYHMLGYFYSEMADIGTYQLDNGTDVPVGKWALLLRKAFQPTGTTPVATYEKPYFGAKDENSVDLYAGNGNWRRGWTYRIIVIDNAILTADSGGSGDEPTIHEFTIPITEYKNYATGRLIATEIVNAYNVNGLSSYDVDFLNNTSQTRAGIKLKFNAADKYLGNYFHVERVGYSGTGGNAYDYGVNVYEGATLQVKCTSYFPF